MFDIKNLSIFKRLLFVSVLVILTFWIAAISILAVAPSDTAEVNTRSAVEPDLIKEPFLCPEIYYITFYDEPATEEYITALDSSIGEINIHIESYKYTPEACTLMKQEINRLTEIKEAMLLDIEHYRAWENEYYYATKTWLFLKQHGYSDVVASGILGNMMVETGGQTLYLKPNLYDKATGSYYGLCQWSLRYKPFVEGMSFRQQLDYLIKDIEKEFKTFGKYYKAGFTYDDFVSMADSAQCALAFAKVYERCGSGGYGRRMKAAEKAYNYFDLKAPLS
jgi:hypothetical protein